MANRFGKYILLEKIGMGGMAEIFKAIPVAEQQSQVAIKRILPQYCSDRKLVSMMINEAKLTASLHHPNIVPTYDFGLVDDQYFLAMLYVDGKDLREIMHTSRVKGKPVPLAAGLFIISQMLAGLDYAHNKRDTYNNPLEIVHRDVSPANIMVCRDGSVKILDFGIAKAATRIGETQAGVLKGKFSYMSPEQARGDKLDRRSDIFAVGILLFEMLALENLFLRENEIQTLQAVRNDKAPKLSSKRRDIPRKVDGLLRKALRKKKERRFQSALEFKQEVDQILTSLWPQEGQDSCRQHLFSLFPRLLRSGAVEEMSTERIIPLTPREEDGKKKPAGKPLMRIAAAVRQAEEDDAPLQAIPPRSQKKGGRGWPLAIPLVLIVSLLAIGGYWFSTTGRQWFGKNTEGLALNVRQIYRQLPGQQEFRQQERTIADLGQAVLAHPPLYSQLRISSVAKRQLSRLPFVEADPLRLKMLEIAQNPIGNGAKVRRKKGSETTYAYPYLGRNIVYRMQEQNRDPLFVAIR